MAQDLSTADLAALEALQPAAADDNPHLFVSIKQCGGCGKTAAAQLQRVRFEAGDDGDLKQESEELGETHLLSDEERQRLARLAERLPATAQAAAEPVPAD